MRTLQSSILKYQQEQRRTQLDVKFLGQELAQQQRQALDADLLRHKAMRP
jgi:hypothetical protein